MAFIMAQWSLRPPWRDEYWALYFSEPGDDLLGLIRWKISNDVHPPLYFSILHTWRQWFDGDYAARALNLVFICVGGALGWALRGGRPKETLLFLGLCATSFWLIFYSAEIRMMSGVFVVCALTVLVGRNLTMGHRVWVNGFVFLGLGAIASLSHCFAAVWVASFGLSLGLGSLARGQARAFLGIGAISFAAILPTACWVLLSRPDQNPGAPAPDLGVLQALMDGLEQVLRGLIIKTGFANLLVVGLTWLGWQAAFRSEQRHELLCIVTGAGLTVGIVFAIQLLYLPFIKERAFIVIIPALLYIASVSLCALKPEQVRAQRCLKWVPVAAIASLPLFSTEFFKDREHYGDVRAFLSQTPQCASIDIVAYERPSEQAVDFSWYFTQRVLRGTYDPGALSLRYLQGATDRPAQDACPVRALAMAMPRGTRGTEEMLAAFRAAHHPVDDWIMIRFGEGRSYIFVSEGGEDLAQPFGQTAAETQP
ncbi:MAG: hypothetical protein AAFZ74_07290 [Pseudomonadota bacterium]